MTSVKNLGQIAGLFVGASEPENTQLIWFDTSSNVHKTFNFGLNSWEVLEPQTISPITYSALVSRAGTTGLTQGQWFKITDRSNVLALAITQTKVQYVANNDVLVIDDLGTNAVYTVTQENLLIDDILGVYDVNTNKLIFSFTEVTPELEENNLPKDYILAQRKSGDSKQFCKFPLLSLLSASQGNNIIWSDGFFFNLYQELANYLDVPNGVVSYEVFQQFQTLISSSIDDVANVTQEALITVGNKILAETTAAKIYSKELPLAPTPLLPLRDIQQGDTLQNIVNRIQQWITKFKTAEGIELPSGWEPETEEQTITSNDNVAEALAKLAYWAEALVTTAKIADEAVTTTKIADEAVTRAKLYPSVQPCYYADSSTPSLFNSTVYLSDLIAHGDDCWRIFHFEMSGNACNISLWDLGTYVFPLPPCFSVCGYLNPGTSVGILGSGQPPFITVPSGGSGKYVKFTFTRRAGTNKYCIDWILSDTRNFIFDENYV